MVEVFKTNVTDPDKARMIIKKIHRTFKYYSANFDLEDCDKILRIQCEERNINIHQLLALLYDIGVYAEVLEDDHIMKISS